MTTSDLLKISATAAAFLLGFLDRGSGAGSGFLVLCWYFMGVAASQIFSTLFLLKVAVLLMHSSEVGRNFTYVAAVVAVLFDLVGGSGGSCDFDCLVHQKLVALVAALFVGSSDITGGCRCGVAVLASLSGNIESDCVCLVCWGCNFGVATVRGWGLCSSMIVSVVAASVFHGNSVTADCYYGRAAVAALLVNGRLHVSYSSDIAVFPVVSVLVL